MKTEEKIFNYIKSGEEHSTLVGKLIMVDHHNDEDDDNEIMEFSKWMTAFIKRANDFAKNVKLEENK